VSNSRPGTETVHHARLVPSIAPPVPAVTTWPSTTIRFAAIIRASFEERHEPEASSRSLSSGSARNANELSTH
jgi:hypothetical protein